MASTIATVAANVRSRLNLGDSPAEPSAGEVAEWVRDAFRFAIGVCPPIRETTVPLDAEWLAPHACEVVYHVAAGHTVLVPGSEWMKRTDGVMVSHSAAAPGDRVTLWYFDAPAINDAVQAVDTTCIFGPDWLEPAVTAMAAKQCELNLAHVAPSADADGHAAMYRVLEGTFNALLEPYQARRGEWLGSMQQAVSLRLQTGDGVAAQSPYTGFRNRSGRVNRLMGVF